MKTLMIEIIYDLKTFLGNVSVT